MALTLTADQLAKLQPKWNHYIPLHNPTLLQQPSATQLAALLLDHKLEVLYGGAAGGGKSIWLAIAALQYVDVPGYNALLLRRTSGMLTAPDSILFTIHKWLRGTDARWKARLNRYEFPNGATLSFGYLQHNDDAYQYDSAQYHFIGFDELGQFSEWAYRFMFGRIRKRKDLPYTIPLRMRAATNPGAQWIKQRFVKERHKDRVFVPAKLTDNPYIDRDAYEQSLNQLDPITRAQRLHGDWDAELEGAMFRREWPLNLVDANDAPKMDDFLLYRFWDLAATVNGDYSVGVLLGMHKQLKSWFVFDIVRGRWTPSNLEQVISRTAARDGRRVRVRFEQEPGSAGKITALNMARLLAGYDVKSYPKVKSKEVSWRPFAAQVENGNVSVLRGPWLSAFLDELYAVPMATNDDQVDAVSGALYAATKEGQGFVGVLGVNTGGKGDGRE